MKANESSPNRNSLEWHIRYFVEMCSWCERKMIIHAFRRAQKGNEKIIYAHCENLTCKDKWEEVRCIGDGAGSAEKLPYDKKKERESMIMRAPRMPVVQMRRQQERGAHMGARA